MKIWQFSASGPLRGVSAVALAGAVVLGLGSGPASAVPFLVDFNADMSFLDQDSENQPFALFARIEGIDVNEATPLLLLTVTFGGLLLSSRGGGGPRPAI